MLGRGMCSSAWKTFSQQRDFNLVRLQLYSYVDVVRLSSGEVCIFYIEGFYTMALLGSVHDVYAAPHMHETLG